MSRIGKKPLLIPENVVVTINKNNVSLKGPKGELSIDVRPEIKVFQKDNSIFSEVVIEGKQSSALWGLTQAMINNMIIGVTQGFEKRLELVGVGYRAKEISNGVELSLGYSHPIVYQAPQGVKIAVEEQKIIIISGIDKQLVGQVAAEIRKSRRPEPYKGKGVRYVDEYVRIKPGKAGKV